MEAAFWTAGEIFLIWSCLVHCHVFQVPDAIDSSEKPSPCGQAEMPCLLICCLCAECTAVWLNGGSGARLPRLTYLLVCVALGNSRKFSVSISLSVKWDW